MTTRREVLKWIPPVVAVVVLPVHAQTTGPIAPEPPNCLTDGEQLKPDCPGFTSEPNT